MVIDWTRRDFLRAGALVGAACSLPTMLQGSPDRVPITAAEFKERLRGPMVSIPTPFTPDFKVDYAGLRRMIAQAMEYGMEIFELTSGNSQFSFLSYEEIKQLTRETVDAVAGKGMTIAATGEWWTERVIDFARYAESVGATALQVPYPPGHGADVVKHYQDIARQTRLPLVLQGNYTKEVLEKLLSIDSIVAMKEDVDLDYLIDTTARFGERLNCFAGPYDWFLVGQPYGTKAYFDTYSVFAPEISAKFWKAVQGKNYPLQQQINLEYDRAFIAGDEGFQSRWHATLEYFGVAGRYLRAPQHSYTDAEMKHIKAFFDKRGLYPRTRK
jgi:4-hydroxy-tetrahydrodipicolinate synthase